MITESHSDFRYQSGWVQPANPPRALYAYPSAIQRLNAS